MGQIAPLLGQICTAWKYVFTPSQWLNVQPLSMIHMWNVSSNLCGSNEEYNATTEVMIDWYLDERDWYTLGPDCCFGLPRGTITPSSSFRASDGAVLPTPFVLQYQYHIKHVASPSAMIKKQEKIQVCINMHPYRKIPCYDSLYQESLIW